jgi:hypothetical protein
MRIRIRNRIQETKPLQADPDPEQTFESQKVEFLLKNILKVSKRSKTNLRRYKSLFEREKTPGLFVIFGQFACFWIRIRFHIPYTDPDPIQPNERGSRWIRIHNRIHNTAF